MPPKGTKRELGLCGCGCGEPLTPDKNHPNRPKKYLFNHQVNLRRLTPMEREDRRQRARVRAAKWGKENAERKAAYIQANQKCIQENRRKYYEENKERLKANRRLRWATDSRREKELARLYRSRNRLRFNRLKEQRRARLRNLSGHHTVEQWLARVSFYGWRCRYCKIALTLTTLTKDHLIPVTRGGSDWPSNLVPCCQSCNSRKYNYTFREYAARLAA